MDWKMIACEPVLPRNSDNSHRTRALLEGDIFAMTIHRAKGKHRTEEEYKQLGVSAGFSQFQALYIDSFHTVLEFLKVLSHVAEKGYKGIKKRSAKHKGIDLVDSLKISLTYHPLADWSLFPFSPQEAMELDNDIYQRESDQATDDGEYSASESKPAFISPCIPGPGFSIAHLT
ncbi:unnamed protein product [Ilex paraguariensis]|uniref:Uncharacterized protein n=1 Tax=Ilex paraguariensis TaxID=185542 RepID=A0ABC8SLE9_9AQUA